MLLFLSSPYVSRGPARLLLLLLACGLAGCQGSAANNYNAQGVQLHRQGQHTAAMQYFQQAARQNPVGGDAYYNIAALQHQQGLRDKNTALLQQAEGYYHQCLDRDPNHLDCRRALATLLNEGGRSQEARTMLQNWVNQYPQLAEARVELARFYDRAGQTDVAEKHLLDALKLNPNQPRALNALAVIRENQGKYALALENYRRSYQLHSQQPEVAQRVADLSRTLRRGNFSQGGTRTVDSGNPLNR